MIQTTSSGLMKRKLSHAVRWS